MAPITGNTKVGVAPIRTTARRTGRSLASDTYGIASGGTVGQDNQWSDAGGYGGVSAAPAAPTHTWQPYGGGSGGDFASSALGRAQAARTPLGVAGNNQYYAGDVGKVMGAYGGHPGTYIAAPNTYINASTAPSGFGSFYGGGSGGGGGGGYGGSAGNPRFGGTYGGAGSGAGGGGAYGGLTADQVGRQLQHDQNAANVANQQINQDRRNNNTTGQAAQQAALDANYGGIYSTINGNRDQQLSLLNGAGSTAHELENRRLTKQQGSTAQSLAGRGLYNSTVLDSEQRGNATDSALIQGSIDERANQQRLGVYSQTGAQMVGAQGDYAHSQLQAQQYGQSNMDRIIDDLHVQGPNPSDYYRLLSQPGAQGGGYGGGGGNNSAGVLEQYLQEQLGQQGAGGNPWVDQQTIQNNHNAGYYKPGGEYNNGDRPVSGTYNGGAGAAYGGSFTGPGGADFGGDAPPRLPGATGAIPNTGSHADPNAPPLPGMPQSRLNRSTGQYEYWTDGIGWVAD